ncbi:hypothetical protein [Kangiella sp. HZ709]|uniref:hypothetical protein n=1 Tax=Kangiella sp. HZ709 TaxID=2666328 RepID=UPI0012B0B0A6|nr:hypothetical protein [Kangiella sp. HZ709]MRX28083.1 hypothetical protein [Kangiella sp. HZ709]
MKKIAQLIFTLSLSLSCTSLWSKTYQEQLDYIKSISTHDISKAKALLESLEPKLEKFSTKEKALYYYLQAHSYSIRGFYQEAWELAEKVSDHSNDKDLAARTESLKVSILSHQGKFQQSFMTTYQLLDGLEQLTSNELKMDILLDAVTLHTYSEILDKAQDLALRSMAFINKEKLIKHKCNLSVEMGLLNIRLKKYQKAADYFEQAESECSDKTQASWLLIVKTQKAKILMLNERHEMAEQSYLKVFDELVSFGWSGLLVDTQIRIAELYLKMEAFDKIEAYALPAYQSAKKNNQLNDLSDVSFVLTRFYEESGEHKKAQEFRRVYIKSSNELKSLLQKRRLAYYQAMNIRKELQKSSLVTREE